jgi:hydrogenase maturation factor
MIHIADSSDRIGVESIYSSAAAATMTGESTAEASSASPGEIVVSGGNGDNAASILWSQMDRFTLQTSRAF